MNMRTHRRSLHHACCLLVLASGCGTQARMGATDEARQAVTSFASLEAESPLASMPDEGIGSEQGGEKYDRIVDNPFQRVLDHPQSTFSIDVDTASYSKVRQYLMEYSQLPRPDAVRIEELLNYFPYQYAPPTDENSEPFATHVAVSQCPWNLEHRLVRLALKGREMKRESRPHSNLVLLIDSSGSMKQPNKLPLLKRGMRLLLEQLGETDRIAIVTYAGSAGLVLDSTPASNADRIMQALNRLQAGGSTNGGEGMQLAYQVARDHFIPGGTNRVLLCTDGDFNVGMTGTDQMLRLVENESKDGIDLTVLGFGMGNLNDAMLEQISGRGNGNYAFIDTYNEAKKVLVEQLTGTLVTIAKDVKIQIEFNPQSVAAYRLIGYENRMLANEDFHDDKKDAGEIGAGHSVTALYELIPTGVQVGDSIAKTDELKYQTSRELALPAQSGELLTVKLRYKLPGQVESKLMERVVLDDDARFEQAEKEFQFAAAVAGFGMLLRNSEYCGDWSFESVQETAQSAMGDDPNGFREEFLEMVAVARGLQGAR